MYIFTHPSCLEHDPSPIQGFAPQRLQTIMEALTAADLSPFLSFQYTAPPATPAQLQLVHTPEHIAHILQPIPQGTELAFDHETFAMSGTAKAILQAAGLAIAATSAVVNGKVAQAFCLTSPGGHHAEAEMVQGYCFCNHVALAAVMAQEEMGLERVAVLDIDTHHGNGTQSLFWNHPQRLFISLHEDTPLSGLAEETGAWHNILNIPLPHGSDGHALCRAIIEQVRPKLTAFRPDILLVSAGFDMHNDDPLGNLALATHDYYRLGAQLQAIAQELCQQRLVCVLEGGYNLEVLGASVAAFVAGIIGK
ncbi:MAG: histone deacetylase family protein [Alphaproteobacteria bacterium]